MVSAACPQMSANRYFCGCRPAPVPVWWSMGSASPLHPDATLFPPPSRMTPALVAGVVFVRGRIRVSTHDRTRPARRSMRTRLPQRVGMWPQSTDSGIPNCQRTQVCDRRDTSMDRHFLGAGGELMKRATSACWPRSRAPSARQGAERSVHPHTSDLNGIPGCRRAEWDDRRKTSSVELRAHRSRCSR
jgi:hypothetical protein